jgi:hypothetical protein
VTIDRALLEAKLAQLCHERDELNARYNARIGAINTLQELLSVVELPEPPPAQPASNAEKQKPKVEPVPTTSPPPSMCR